MKKCQSKVVMSYSCKVEMSYCVRCKDENTSRKGGLTPDESNGRPQSLMEKTCPGLQAGPDRFTFAALNNHRPWRSIPSIKEQ